MLNALCSPIYKLHSRRFVASGRYFQVALCSFELDLACKKVAFVSKKGNPSFTMSKLSEEYGGDLGEKPTIWGALVNNVAKRPDALALVCTHQPLGLFGVPNIDLDNDTYRQRPYLRWSYQDLRDAIGRLVAALQAHDVQEGSVVATFVGNGVEYVLAA